VILDIALLVIGIIAIATGYNRGALATLFSLIGYLGGGVAALLLPIGIPQIGRVSPPSSSCIYLESSPEQILENSS
jgi:uncharacterized membrane protein required for colicin V production